MTIPEHTVEVASLPSVLVTDDLASLGTRIANTMTQQGGLDR